MGNESKNGTAASIGIAIFLLSLVLVAVLVVNRTISVVEKAVMRPDTALVTAVANATARADALAKEVDDLRYRIAILEAEDIKQ